MAMISLMKREIQSIVMSFLEKKISGRVNLQISQLRMSLRVFIQSKRKKVKNIELGLSVNRVLGMITGIPSGLVMSIIMMNLEGV